MVREDDLRATFSALNAEEAPPRAVTAADLIQRGRTVRSRRRAIAVGGTAFATFGVVGLALAVLPPSAPPDPLTPGPSSTTQTQVPTTTEPASSVQSTPMTTAPTEPQSSHLGSPPTKPSTSSSPPATSEPPEPTTPGMTSVPASAGHTSPGHSEVTTPPASR
jgi:hypothetical protein